MIHWTPEGELYHNGLNIYWTFFKSGWWFRVVWHWYGATYYFRFRSYLTPHFILKKTRYDI